MEDFKREMHQVKIAVFGDPQNLKENPGLVQEVRAVERDVSSVMETCNAMRADIKRGVWLILTAVIVAGLAVVIKTP